MVSDEYQLPIPPKQIFIGYFATNLALLRQYTTGDPPPCQNHEARQRLGRLTTRQANLVAHHNLKALKTPTRRLADLCQLLAERNEFGPSEQTDLQLHISDLEQAYRDDQVAFARQRRLRATQFLYLLTQQPTRLPDGLHQALEQQGYALNISKNPDDLIKDIASVRPDAVILDIELMENLNEALVSQLKALLHEQQGERAMLLLLGSDNRLEQHRLAEKAGAQGYQCLPSNAQHLAQWILSQVETANQGVPVIVVEANPNQADSLSLQLRGAGMRVYSFIDPDLVAASARHIDPDLVFLDLDMPNLKGWELSQELKLLPNMTLTPIIYLANPLTINQQVALLDIDRERLLAKPPRPFHLAHLAYHEVQKVLAMRKRPLLETRGARLNPNTGLIERDTFLRLVNKALNSSRINEYMGLVTLHLDTSAIPPSDEATAQLWLSRLLNHLLQHLQDGDLLGQLEPYRFGLLLTRRDEQASAVAAGFIALLHTLTEEHPEIKIKVGSTNLDEETADAAQLIFQAQVDCMTQLRPDGSSSGTEEVLEQLLRNSLRKGERAFLGERLTLSYQPLQGTDHSASYEWQQAHLSLPNQARPIPVRLLLEQLQDHELSWQFDNHLLHLAIQRLAEHRQEVPPKVLLITLSDNLLQHPERVEILREELRAHRMTGTGLILSFDTTQAITAGDLAEKTMQAFKPLGVRVCFRHFHGTPAHLLGVERLKPMLVAPSSNLVMKAEQRAIDLIAYNLAKLSVGICLLPQENEQPFPQSWRRIAKLGTD